MRAAGQFIALVALLAIAAGGYVAYRFNALPGHDQPAFARFPDYARTKPAFACTASKPDFTHSYAEDMYSASGFLRIDSKSDGEKADHVIIDPKGKVYEWKEGAATGVSSTLGESAYAPGASPMSADHCSPWWLPDGSVFAIPANVTFQPSASS